MKIFKKLFLETKITWKLLLIYSILTGVIVGLLNCVPFLADTSLVYPAVTYEYWFVAAIFIISNCKSAKEAMIKTFIFFLISQPLIYLVEVPFKSMGWGLFSYYKYWAMITVLTIPGAFIAYQIKKDNILSPIVLSVATGYLLLTGIICVKGLLTSFPKGLLAAIFCIAFCVILIQVILQSKKNKIIAYVCSVILAIILFIITCTTGASKNAGILLEEGQWEIVESNINVDITGSYLNANSSKKGTYYVIVQNENNERVKYEIIFDDNNAIINQVDE